jgi:hypothetical protein
MKVRVNRKLTALAAALQRGGRLRGLSHERQARMPRLDVSGSSCKSEIAQV